MRSGLVSLLSALLLASRSSKASSSSPTGAKRSQPPRSVWPPALASGAASHLTVGDLVFTNATLREHHELARRVRAGDPDAAPAFILARTWHNFEECARFAASTHGLTPQAFDILEDAWAALKDPESIDDVISKIENTGR